MDLNPNFSNSTKLPAGSTARDQSPSLESRSKLVDIQIERVEGRQRRITAKIHIPYSVEEVWQILTDYEKLADFIPNLTKSRRVTHPHGGVRLEQIGSQSFLKLRFCARVVLDMVENFPNQLDFQMVEGDFKEFFGSWCLKPHLVENQMGTELCYIVNVLPPQTMPVAIIERRLSHNLSMNLAAILRQAELLFGKS
jgi:ribosome-associated toxin RatA of RatAB toxin-antitoxin module